MSHEKGLHDLATLWCYISRDFPFHMSSSSVRSFGANLISPWLAGNLDTPALHSLVQRLPGVVVTPSPIGEKSASDQSSFSAKYIDAKDLVEKYWDRRQHSRSRLWAELLRDIDVPFVIDARRLAPEGSITDFFVVALSDVLGTLANDISIISRATGPSFKSAGIDGTHRYAIEEMLTAQQSTESQKGIFERASVHFLVDIHTPLRVRTMLFQLANARIAEVHFESFVHSPFATYFSIELPTLGISIDVPRAFIRGIENARIKQFNSRPSIHSSTANLANDFMTEGKHETVHQSKLEDERITAILDWWTCWLTLSTNGVPAAQADRWFESLGATSARLAVGLADDEELALITKALVLRGDGHCRVFKDSHFHVRNIPPIVCYTTDASCLVRESLDSELPISPGCEILTIDGQSYQDRFDEKRSEIGGPIECVFAHADYAILHGIEPIVDIKYKTPGGAVKQTHLNRELASFTIPRPPNHPEVLGLNNSTTYVNLSALNWDSIPNAVQELCVSDAWILDFRCWISEDIGLSLFQQIVPRNVRLNGGAWIERGQWEGQSFSLRNPLVIQSGPTNIRTSFPSRVVAIINRSTISGGEVLAVAARDIFRPVFVGERTSGSAGRATKVRLGRYAVMYTGDEFISANGQRIYGNGLAPDISIQPTAADFVASRDVEFETAVRLIEEDNFADSHESRLL